jgi:fatty acid desaturase
MREVAGIALIVVAISIAPAGWFWSGAWWAASVVLVLVGLFLFHSTRIQRRERRERELGATDNPGDAVDRYAPGPLSPSRVRRSDLDSGDAGGDFDSD